MKIEIKKIGVIIFTFLIVSFSTAFIPPEIPFAPSFYGEFKIKKIMNYYDSSSKYVRYIAFSNLYSDSVHSSQSWKANSFGQVYYNNIGLRYNSAIKTYMDTIERKFNSGTTWSVIGSTVCPSFTVTMQDSFPNFDYNNCLPSVLKKSENFRIVVNGNTNTDEIQVTMYDGQFRLNFPFYRRMSHNGPNQIIIPHNNLTSLSGQGVIVTVSLIKYEFKIINGKRFKFEKRFDLVRPMPLQN